MLWSAVGLLLCAAIVFPLAFIALGAGHTCVGHECRICSVIHRFQFFLRGLICVAMLPGVLISAAKGLFKFSGRNAGGVALRTLVSLKVKLSN